MRVTTQHPNTTTTPSTPTTADHAPAGAASRNPEPDRPDQRHDPRRGDQPAPRSRARAVGRGLWSMSLVLAVAAVLLVATQPALAHAAEPTTSVLAQGQTSGQVEQLIQRATNWLTGLLAALASLYVVMAGVRYLCSGGKPAEVAHAKEALKSAGIGYGIAALAQLVVQILTELVGQ